MDVDSLFVIYQPRSVRTTGPLATGAGPGPFHLSTSRVAAMSARAIAKTVDAGRLPPPREIARSAIWAIGSVRVPWPRSLLPRPATVLVWTAVVLPPQVQTAIVAIVATVLTYPASARQSRGSPALPRGTMSGIETSARLESHSKTSPAVVVNRRRTCTTRLGRISRGLVSRQRRYTS